ncbi:MAG: ABC transporter ATP-binding protein [Lachnospiraceae bacterium]|nr:ABC transporter ATP-binding protein [Lachnospiraceae bacterium]
MERKGRGKTLRRILSGLAAYRGLIALMLVLAAVHAAASLYIPLLVGRGIDRMIGAGRVDFPGLYGILIRIAAAAACGGTAQWGLGVIGNRVAYGAVRDLRTQAFAKIQKLPLSYLDRHPVGEVTSRLIADADQFSEGLILGFSQLFSGAVTIAGTLLFMLRLSPAVTAVVVVLTPLSFVVAGFIARRTYAMFRAQTEARGAQTALIDEMVGSQKVVKAFSQEAEAQARFDAAGEKLRSASVSAIFFSSITNPSTRFVNAVTYAAVALFGALAVIRGAFSVGSLSTFLSYASQYMKPFNEISGVVTEMQSALACADRIFELLDEEEETPDAPGSLPDDAPGAVTVSGVDFGYVPGKTVLKDISLTAAPGERIAIVGPTGCGKTTLIQLLMRFYDPQAGEIRVDGQEVRSLTRRSLRSRFGMVLQDTWLPEGTVRQILCMGRPDASEEEMIAAARAAHAHSFIRRLPKGYDTVIREGGEGLSAGQRQLLCIARVMLTDPPMLILDEATSSIDTRTEVKVQQAFEELMKGRTSFIVAHRLSTIRGADQILVMKDGEILERGRHEELLARNGFYAQMHAAGYRPEEG